MGVHTFNDVMKDFEKQSKKAVIFSIKFTDVHNMCDIIEDKTFKRKNLTIFKVQKTNHLI